MSKLRNCVSSVSVLAFSIFATASSAEVKVDGVIPDGVIVVAIDIEAKEVHVVNKTECGINGIALAADVFLKSKSSFNRVRPGEGQQVKFASYFQREVVGYGETLTFSAEKGFSEAGFDLEKLELKQFVFFGGVSLEDISIPGIPMGDPNGPWSSRGWVGPQTINDLLEAGRQLSGNQHLFDEHTAMLSVENCTNE